MPLPLVTGSPTSRLKASTQMPDWDFDDSRFLSSTLPVLQHRLMSSTPSNEKKPLQEHVTINRARSTTICQYDEPVKGRPAKGNQYKPTWMPEEDAALLGIVTRNVGKRAKWKDIAEEFNGLFPNAYPRHSKQCRNRWINHLDPTLDLSPLRPSEQEYILDSLTKVGQKWSKIAQELPGRTDHFIKNFYNHTIKRQLVQQGTINTEPTKRKVKRASSMRIVSDTKRPSVSSDEALSESWTSGSESDNGEGIPRAKMNENAFSESTLDVLASLLSEPAERHLLTKPSFSLPPLPRGNSFKVASSSHHPHGELTLTKQLSRAFSWTDLLVV